MKTFLLCAAVAAATLAVVPASADESFDNPFYVQADVGHASITRQALSSTTLLGGGVNGTATTKTVAAGFDVNQYFGVEGGYHDYGNPLSYRSTPVYLTCPQDFACPHITGFSVEAVGRYEMMPRFSVELLAGVLHWSGSDPAQQLLGENSGNVALYGGRLLWAATENLSVGVTYQHSEFTTDETSLSLRYLF